MTRQWLVIQSFLHHSAQHSVDQANSGGTISLRNGIDNEVVTVKRLGIRDNPIMIKADPEQKPF